MAIAALALATGPGPAGAQVAPAPAPPEVQSLLLRTVTITDDLERCLLFYRDILGQELVELRRLDTARSRGWLELGPRAEVWFAVLRGSGEYAGGPVTGGRIAFLGIRDPDASPRAARPPPRPVKGRPGDLVLPHRVANLAEIERRLAQHGFPVLVPAATSSTGLSRSMMVMDPHGRIVELFEMAGAPPTTPPGAVALPAPRP
ncbi:MAG: VOC family protein [Steroidobacteraceae bacterium]|jgi:catechol 2,3-dioxygenase-like lactoylglutathione lyase family enzyme|nr:VOC family protein [Steroidobacteraceae bacterium]